MGNGETKQEISPSPDEIQPSREEAVAGDDGKEEEPLEVSEEVKAEFESKKSDFERFFKLMKRYRDEGWTPAKLEAQSQGLRPLIQEFRRILGLGGAANRDHLLEAVVKVAQEARYENDFWQRISEHGKMSYGSDLERFYRFFVQGLQKQLEASQAKKG